MASFKVNHPAKTLRADTLLVSGRFAPAGTGAPTIPDSGKNRGWSVTRTDVGDFTITFSGFDFLALESFTAFVNVANDAEPHKVQGHEWDASAKTMQITLMKETTGTNAAADLTADANNFISFQATFRTSSV